MSSNEPSSTERRGLELLHSVARQALERQVDHFAQMEQKIWRHFALLAAILGVFAVGLPSALDAWNSSSGHLKVAFGASYLVMLGLAFSGVFCFARALKYEVLWVDPITETFFEEYSAKPYHRQLVALTKGAIESYQKNRAAFDRKEHWSLWGFRLTVAVLVAASATLVLYLLLSL